MFASNTIALLVSVMLTLYDKSTHDRNKKSYLSTVECKHYGLNIYTGQKKENNMVSFTSPLYNSAVQFTQLLIKTKEIKIM